MPLVAQVLAPWWQRCGTPPCDRRPGRGLRTAPAVSCRPARRARHFGEHRLERPHVAIDAEPRGGFGRRGTHPLPPGRIRQRRGRSPPRTAPRCAAAPAPGCRWCRRSASRGCRRRRTPRPARRGAPPRRRPGRTVPATGWAPGAGPPGPAPRPSPRPSATASASRAAWGLAPSAPTRAPPGAPARSPRPRAVGRPPCRWRPPPSRHSRGRCARPWFLRSGRGTAGASGPPLRPAGRCGARAILGGAATGSGTTRTEAPRPWRPYSSAMCWLATRIRA